MLEISYFLFLVVIVSLSGALMPGPVLAVVVRNSPRNHWAGIEAAFGHGLIELPLVVAIALGFKHLFASNTAQVVIGLVGHARAALLQEEVEVAFECRTFVEGVELVVQEARAELMGRIAQRPAGATRGVAH